MRVVTSLCLDSRNLIVIVYEREDTGVQYAYGVDPALDPQQVQFEFIRTVGNLGAFLKALVDDNEGEFLANSVDVPNKPPPTPWPKMQAVVEYAQALQANQLPHAASAVHAA